MSAGEDAVAGPAGPRHRGSGGPGRGRSWQARPTPRRTESEHVDALVAFAMDGPCGIEMPALLWCHDGRLTLALDLEEEPDPDSTLVQALHAGLVEREMRVDLVHDHRVVLVLGDHGTAAG